jgi:hypothetical protein
MENWHWAVMVAAAKLDALLARAADEFAASPHHRLEKIEAEKRVRALVNQARSLRSSPRE